MEGGDEGGKSAEEQSLLSRGRRESAEGIVLEVEVGPKEKTTKKTRMSKRQWILLIFFGGIDVLAAMMIALQAPFYPQEAESKGATATEYGAIFGIFEFVIFVASPIYGKYMNKIGPKNVFSTSIVVSSVSVVCFGLLHRINDHTWFITLGFVCRIFEALGAAGFFTATFVMIGCEFPDSVATTFATLETFIGLGLIIGPTVGGALFDLGGFSLPFFVTGGLLAALGFSSMLILPRTARATAEDGTEEKGYGIWTILKIPSVAIAALSIISTAMSLGFISATLEPHIRQFGLTPVETGLVFITNAGVYALTAPLFGYICDTVKHPVYITLLGNMLICLSFFLIGPADFVPVDTILWVTIVGLFIQGLGFGCCFVSTFIVGLRDSMKAGLPDNLATYAVCSGLWQSMISLGAWIGPSVGGVLFDLVGFREGSWLIIIASLVAGMAIVMYLCICPPSTSCPPDKSESKPLLGDSSSGTRGTPNEGAITGSPKTSYGST